MAQSSVAPSLASPSLASPSLAAPSSGAGDSGASSSFSELSLAITFIKRQRSKLLFGGPRRRKRDSRRPSEPNVKCRPCFERRDHEELPGRLLRSSYVSGDGPSDAELRASVDPDRPTRRSARACEVRATLPSTLLALAPSERELGEPATSMDFGPWRVDEAVIAAAFETAELTEVSFAPVRRSCVQDGMVPWVQCTCSECLSLSCRLAQSGSILGAAVRGSDLRAALEKSRPSIEKLRLAYCRGISTVDLRGILGSLSSTLRDLDLGGCGQLGDDAAVDAIAHGGLTALRWLSLNGWTQLTERGLTAVVDACPDLTTLQLCHCERLTDAAVRTALDGCPELREFDLTGLSKLRGDCFAEEQQQQQRLEDPAEDDEASGIALVKVRSCLERLDLGECKALASPVLRWIATSVPRLTSLRLAGVTAVHDEGLRALANAPNVALRCLDVHGCTGLCRDDGAAFFLLVRHQGPHLRYLDVRGLQLVPAVVRAFFETLHLDCLRLDRSTGLDDTSFGGEVHVAAVLDDAEAALGEAKMPDPTDEPSAVLLRAYSRRRNSSVLQRRNSSAIALRRSSSIDSRRRESSFVVALKKQHKRGSSLYASVASSTRRGSSIHHGTRRKSSSSFSRPSRGSRHGSRFFSTMEMLTASECQLSAGALVAMLSKMPRLRVLDLTHAAHGGVATDATMYFIAKHCPALQVLRIARPTPTQVMSHVVLSQAFLTDASLFHLAMHLRYLEELDLSNHVYVTGQILEFLKGAWPLLRSLAVVGCKGITPRGLRALAATAPNLLKLDYTEEKPSPLSNLQPDHFDHLVQNGKPYVAAHVGGFGPVPGAAAAERRDEVWTRFWQEDAAATVLACAYRDVCVRERIRRREAAKIVVRAVRSYRERRRDVFYYHVRLLVSYRRLVTRFASSRIQRWYLASLRKRRNAAATKIQLRYRHMKLKWLDILFDLMHAAATMIQALFRSYRSRLHDALAFKRIDRRWHKEVGQVDALSAKVSDIRSRRAVSDMKANVAALRESDTTSSSRKRPREDDAVLSLGISRKRRIAIYSDEVGLIRGGGGSSGVHVFGGVLWPLDEAKVIYEPRSDLNPRKDALEREKLEARKKQRDLAIAAGGYESAMPWRDTMKGTDGLMPPLARARLAQGRREKIVDKATAVAEAKKMEEAKRLEAALEKEAEEEERRAEAAAAASQERHDASSRMAAVARGREARKAVVKKCRDRATTKTQAEATRTERAVKAIQRIARGRSARGYVSEHQIFDSLRDVTDIEVRKSKMKTARHMLAVRVDRDLKLRRSSERVSAILGRKDLTAQCDTAFDATLQQCEDQWWKPLDAAHEKLTSSFAANDVVVTAMRAEIDGRDDGWGDGSGQTSATTTFAQNRKSMLQEQMHRQRMSSRLKATLPGHHHHHNTPNNKATAKRPTTASARLREIELGMRGSAIRQKHLKYSLEAVDAARWWAVEAARCCYRRHRARQVMSTYTDERLQWIAEEAVRVWKLTEFIRNRRATTPATIENRYLIQWLDEQATKLQNQRCALDAEQEHLLERDASFMRDLSEIEQRAMGLTDEYVAALFTHDYTYDAEKVGLELARMMDSSSEKSNEALRQLQNAADLKEKQEALHSGVHLLLREKLEQLYAQETDRLERYVSFQGDERDLPREKLPLISASLAHPKPMKKLFEVEKWLDVYRSQPWLAQQDIEETRRREAHDIKKLKEANMAGIIDQKKLELEQERKQIDDLEEEFAAMEDILASLSTTKEEKHNAEVFLSAHRPRLDRLKEDYQRREENLRKLEDQLSAFRTELDLEEKEAKERMERSKAAKADFDRREGDEEQKQSVVNEKRAREIYVELRAIDEDLKDADAETRAKLVARKLDLEAELEKIQKEQAKTHERAARREALAKAAEAEAKAEEELKRKKELQAKLRQQKKEEAAAKARRKAEEKHAEEEEKKEQQRQKAQALAIQRAKDVLSDMGLEDPTERKEKMPLKQKLKEAVRKKLTGHTSVEQEKHEQTQMLQSLQRRQQLKIGAVTALRGIQFTVGKEETESFATKQNSFANRSLPHYTRLRKTIGLTTQIVIWIEETAHQDDFITDLELAATNEDHPLYKDYYTENKDNWIQYTHTALVAAGEDGSASGFAIWGRKRSKAVYAISSLAVSYTVHDEEVLVQNGYNKIETCLSEFGFGENLYLWIKRVNRNVEPKLESEATVLQELKHVQKELKQRPNDESAIERQKNLAKRLQKVREEQDYRDKYKSDPLKYAIEFLALTQHELEKWMKYFERIDRDRDGYVTPTEILETLRLKKTAFASNMFSLLGGTESDEQKMDFGETVKCLGSFCMFAEKEVLHFAFRIFDKDESGTMTHDEFIVLLSDLHPEDNRGQTTRALKEVNLSENGTFTFDQFVDVHRKFPGILSPALRFQHSIRAYFFGDRFWDDKLRRYMDRNAQIKRDRAMNADLVQASEDAASNRRQRRQDQIQAKKDAALNTTSILRRTLLTAQIQSLQFAAKRDPSP